MGFPGETEEHFSALMDFIETTRFERLGVFNYSQEEGSRAGKMDGQISTRTKNRRHREAMALQQRIALEMAEGMIGRRLRVLVTHPNVARTEYDAPEVDCRMILTKPCEVGEFTDVQVVGSQMYDLIGEPV